MLATLVEKSYRMYNSHSPSWQVADFYLSMKDGRNPLKQAPSSPLKIRFLLEDIEGIGIFGSIFSAIPQRGSISP